ncbi:MAG: glutathione S-transferase family protein [Myxococcota bacterium]
MTTPGSDSPTLDFYWGSGSPYAWRAMLALELKGLTYGSHLLEFSKKEHRSEKMLALNPRGKVPVLVHGETVMYESVAIMAYLDRAFSEPPLFGTTAAETGLVWRLVSEHDGYLAPLGLRLARPIFMGKVEENREDIDAAIEELNKELGQLNTRLVSSPWLAGERVSAADVFFWVSLQQVIRAAGKPSAKDLNLGVDPLSERYPELAEWSERFGALPGVDRTWPPHWT